MVLSCPAQYRRLVESAIALAVADARRDEKRRGDGDLPTVRAPLYDASATGRLVIMVGVPDEAREARDAAWPGEAHPGAGLDCVRTESEETPVRAPIDLTLSPEAVLT